MNGLGDVRKLLGTKTSILFLKFCFLKQRRVMNYLKSTLSTNLKDSPCYETCIFMSLFSSK